MHINPLFLVTLVTGAIFLAAGFVIIKYPPKTINYWYGYRTTNSMKSQERWDFAQPVAGYEMLKSGGILILISLPGWLLNFNIREGIGLIVGIALIIIFSLIPLFRTERALKQRFGKST